MIGLGAHSLFEGIALGLKGNTDSDISQIYIISLAIILHKGAAGMSLGISMQKTFPDDNAFVMKLLILFACFTPMGVIIGWILETGSELTEIIFSCLAAGTFIYIACSEVIVEEFSQPDNKILKLLFFMIGILFISSLLLLE